MTRELGVVEAIFRYPVKSMACERLDAADVGWHGLEGDRRFAVRRIDERGEKPWLTASRLADLVRFVPVMTDGIVTHVRTPDGSQHAVFSEELAAEIERRYGKPVQMMRLHGGIFDEAAISVIAMSTIRGIGDACGRELEPLRFRPNILLRTNAAGVFEEDAWVGHVLAFGDNGPEVAITLRDERCAMLNLDPDTAESDPRVMKAVVRLNDNKAGVYGTVTRCGRLAVGQSVRLR